MIVAGPASCARTPSMRILRQRAIQARPGLGRISGAAQGGLGRISGTEALDGHPPRIMLSLVLSRLPVL
jgi:hypothetical protein